MRGRATCRDSATCTWGATCPTRLSLDAESLQPLSLVAPEGSILRPTCLRRPPSSSAAGGNCAGYRTRRWAGYPSGVGERRTRGCGRGGRPAAAARCGNDEPPGPIRPAGCSCGLAERPAIPASKLRYLRCHRVPLTDAYRPVASGAYSLAETYGLTAEAFEDALDRLAPGGLLGGDALAADSAERGSEAGGYGG